MDEKMKTWIYFYIEHTIQKGSVFKKEPGWALSGNLELRNTTLDG